MTRLSGGLAETLSAIEMTPLKLQVRGTAGCGKSVLATRFAEDAAAAGKRVMLVCFNRPLAERIKVCVPHGVYVDTFYGLMDRFLISRGHKLSYERIGEPNFWQDIQDRVIGETIGPDWKFDALIVDEGQDFEAQWNEILRLFLKPDADILWFEFAAVLLPVFATAGVAYFYPGSPNCPWAKPENTWAKFLNREYGDKQPRETLINAAMRSFAAQGNVFSCQSRQLTTAGGSGWPWCRQADASVLRARYRFASANSENTWAPFLAMPR